MRRIIILLITITAGACSSGTIQKGGVIKEESSSIYTNRGGTGPEIIIEFRKGDSFYYPLMSVWLEDASGKFIQSLFVPASVAHGVFKYGKQENNKWVKAPKRAPQTLPYWSHKRGIIASDGLYMPEPGNSVSDAYSGATPTSSFILYTRSDKALPDVFRVLLEINQNWDWNDYWTNDKFPDDENYKMSCQPALVYESMIDINDLKDRYKMNPIGHSHYSGKTGELFSDLSTLTTALHIADSIIIKVKR